MISSVNAQGCISREHLISLLETMIRSEDEYERSKGVQAIGVLARYDENRRIILEGNIIGTVAELFQSGGTMKACYWRALLLLQLDKQLVVSSKDILVSLVQSVPVGWKGRHALKLLHELSAKGQYAIMIKEVDVEQCLPNRFEKMENPDVDVDEFVRQQHFFYTPNKACTQPRPETMIEYLMNYHVIFIIDDSTSMIYYGRRWGEARDALCPIADYALQYKADTIDVYFLNSSNVYTAVQTSAFIMQVFDQTRPPNPPPIQWTPTGACLHKILNAAIDQLDAAIDDPVAYEKIKPFDIVLLTDGDPSDNPKPVLENAWARLQDNHHHPNYIGIKIVQIGNDPLATAKLKDLMSGNIGDLVETVPYNGIVTPDYFQRMLLGALHHNVRAKLS